MSGKVKSYISTTIALPSDIYTYLKELAKKEERPLSQIIRLILTKIVSKEIKNLKEI